MRKEGMHSVESSSFCGIILSTKRVAQVLKMNQDQWTRAFEHAMRAVDVDNTARVWLPKPTNGSPTVGLVFSCKRGRVDMQRPLGRHSSGAHS